MLGKNNALKYGYTAPLQDYFTFNTSRQNDVRTTIYSYFLIFSITPDRTGAMTENN